MSCEGQGYFNQTAATDDHMSTEISSSDLSHQVTGKFVNYLLI